MHTLKLKFKSFYHMFITHETKACLLVYVSYTGGLWRVLQYYPLILVTINFRLRQTGRHIGLTGYIAYPLESKKNAEIGKCKSG